MLVNKKTLYNWSARGSLFNKNTKVCPLHVCPLRVCPLRVCPLRVCPLHVSITCVHYVCVCYMCVRYMCPLHVSITCVSVTCVSVTGNNTRFGHGFLISSFLLTNVIGCVAFIQMYAKIDDNFPLTIIYTPLLAYSLHIYENNSPQNTFLHQKAGL